MIGLCVLLAIFVGVTVGLLGGGGSILTVPLLAYVAGLDSKHAITTSLLVVSVTSAVSAIAYARAGRLWWRTAVLFGATGMVGGYAGGLLAGYVADRVLMFAARPCDNHRIGWTAPVGVQNRRVGCGVGMLSALVGAGGGFLVVPVLALLGEVPLPVAVGTSLVVVSMQSLAGLAGHLATEHIDWQLAIVITAAAVLGGLIGGRLAGRVHPHGCASCSAGLCCSWPA